ncbi:MAG: ImmA/IrrE family metallo-endopeptidase [Limosilactobacillus oris]|jgi:Zn-dependent peptidase ImmA (M78 family)|uniref:ImmA/IrrE family metallo-endopeptidase n=1 Tax=Limosilactobacillus oris TaxID=1632 RepID=UPI00242BE23B|nr:ImmA/IrrE family metallo-endopeptidase [Limosilactobacillus oris]MCH3911463.1 ImmA/IrrE family metallo-endopeptidase [Limosilactobacillus oris]MCH3938713.1 ImmA/IrrE family metallo-endopeptidase [Limosilactobacillus oris]MCI1980159.1 ImmA/IrrE family metallo-endopeptidase [Limosilactobacillus oris]MCI2042917.1 ImmA/IrrE family metallo-endopeptidase [Limosilactobacillus oris]
MYLQDVDNNYIYPLFKVELNHCDNLVDYNVKNLFPKIFKGFDVTYLEFPFDTKDILGHTMKDSLGLSVTVNKNINDPARKLFTQAHEFGHILIHEPILKSSSIDFVNSIKESNLNKVEQEANWFAANLILPVQVAYAHIIEKHTAKQIRFFSGLSVQSSLFRLGNVLKKIYWIQDEQLIERIIKQYESCKHSYEVELSALYKILNQGYKLPHIDSTSAIEEVQNSPELIAKLRQNSNLADSIAKSSLSTFH